jgi:hypothetical protein
VPLAKASALRGGARLLHAGLCHANRCGARDFFLWNAACDFAVNGWLIEMAVGTPPGRGFLHDPALKGQWRKPSTI